MLAPKTDSIVKEENPEKQTSVTEDDKPKEEQPPAGEWTEVYG